MPPNTWTAGVAAFSHARFDEGHIGEIIHLREKFKAATPDIEWITTLGKEGGWTIISRDGFRKKMAPNGRCCGSMGFRYLCFSGRGPTSLIGP
ncbi:hypothetical protein [Variovorax paradoxus]|uniref:PIN-like domain-containing protein n=1 Tax=Variovorax paradoxus TaxID=34073 RepID=UPI001931A215|nr:hypothetical protein INQ48_29275 [Variovorax paradoxus]